MKKTFSNIILVFICSCLFFCNSIAQNIYAFAGTGVFGYSGDGAAAVSAKLAGPIRIAVDASGNVFVTENFNHCVRKINTSGVISTIAGTGVSGFSGDGGLATLAQLYSPGGITLDAGGNIYISDTGNQRIRKINTSGIISTIAGVGTIGFSGDGGTATLAQFSGPSGIALDISGNIYCADYNNHRIRKINTSGVISTIAGTGTAGFFGDGGPATSAQIMSPLDVTTDASGNIYIADGGNDRIRKINATGTITTIAGNGFAAYFGDGGAATSAGLFNPSGVELDASGNVYIADKYNNCIRKVNTSGIISTIGGNSIAGNAGDGGLATLAQMNQPSNLAIDALGNIYVTDYTNQRVRIICSTNCPVGTDINSLSENTSIKTGVYPNPAKDLLQIANEQNLFENSEIEITNTLGQLIFKLPYKSPIDVSKLSPGFYNLKIISQNKQFYYSKFIKE